jgi:hypothetical protein
MCQEKLDKKAMVDALNATREYWLKRYQEKTALEWRVSFGIWVLLSGTIGLIITEKLGPSIFINIVMDGVLLLVLLLVIIGHFCFLTWIQKKLDKYRKEMEKSTNDINNILNGSSLKINGDQEEILPNTDVIEKLKNTFKVLNKKYLKSYDLSDDIQNFNTQSGLIGLCDKITKSIGDNSILWSRLTQPTVLIQGFTTLIFSILLIVLIYSFPSSQDKGSDAYLKYENQIVTIDSINNTILIKQKP